MSEVQTFAGFPGEALEFFAGLEANNDRAWFAANRAAYDRAVKWPGEAYVAQVQDGLRERLGREVRAKTFRIHRDIRFSKDKRPYNAYLHIAFLETAAQAAPAGFYMGLDARRLTLGAGAFDLSSPLLLAYREAVIDEKRGARLGALLEGLQAKGWRLHTPALKRIPPGFAPEHPRAELLRHKSLTIFCDVEDRARIASPGIVGDTLAAFEAAAPLNDWLGELRA
jgi:uncharacterized protein (TIGR02453 family)